MTRATSSDPSRGYDAVANEFAAARSEAGRSVVRRWAATLPPGGSVIDVGAGHGEPLTSVLVDAGLNVWAIDASPVMAAAFARRFPDVPVTCEAAERSTFFGRRFDAVLMVGLVFLLTEDEQHELLRRVVDALVPAGRLLFSAPREEATWTDVLTGRASSSLGAEGYGRVLSEVGLRCEGSCHDEGGNHYYEVRLVR